MKIEEVRSALIFGGGSGGGGGGETETLLWENPGTTWEETPIETLPGMSGAEKIKIVYLETPGGAEITDVRDVVSIGGTQVVRLGIANYTYGRYINAVISTGRVSVSAAKRLGAQGTSTSDLVPLRIYGIKKG